MTTDTHTREVEDAWPEVLADSWEVPEHARQGWRDEDRDVSLDEDERERS